MEAFARFLSVLAIPLGIINIFGGIISGIWLAILGKWGLIGYGLLAIIVSDMGLGIAMMPGLIFAAPAAVLIEKGNKRQKLVSAFTSDEYIEFISDSRLKYTVPSRAKAYGEYSVFIIL